MKSRTSQKTNKNVKISSTIKKHSDCLSQDECGKYKLYIVPEFRYITQQMRRY